MGEERSTCPDEETMACYVEELLELGEKEWIERHFAQCQRCREIVEVTKMVWRNEKNGEVLEVPRELVEWARGLAQ